MDEKNEPRNGKREADIEGRWILAVILIIVFSVAIFLAFQSRLFESSVGPGIVEGTRFRILNDILTASKIDGNWVLTNKGKWINMAVAPAVEIIDQTHR